MNRVTFFLLFFFIASIRCFAQVPIPYQDEKTNKYGYKDSSGKVVIKPMYDVAYEFTDGKYAEVNIGRDYVDEKGGKWGIIDTKGKIVHQVKYDNARCLGYGLFALNKGHVFSTMDASPSGKYAIFNAAGKQLTPFIYSGFLSAVQFEEGFAILETMTPKGQRYGLLDSTGKVIVPLKYEWVGGFREGYCLLKLNEKYGFMNKAAKIAIPLKYEDAGTFSEGLAKVALNGKYGLIDGAGKIIIPLEYDDAKYCTDGFVPVKKNDKWGVISKENKVEIDFQYEDIVWIKDKATIIRVKKGKDYVNLDREGNEVN